MKRKRKESHEKDQAGANCVRSGAGENGGGKSDRGGVITNITEGR
jgi:hypothetical protein